MSASFEVILSPQYSRRKSPLLNSLLQKLQTLPMKKAILYMVSQNMDKVGLVFANRTFCPQTLRDWITYLKELNRLPALSIDSNHECKKRLRLGLCAFSAHRL